MNVFLDEQQERGYLEQSSIESFAGEYFGEKKGDALAFLKKKYNIEACVSLPRAAWDILYEEIKDQF